MRRNGTIAVIVPPHGLVAIATEDDGYTIIELLPEWDLEIGDAISWANGDALGDEVYENLTKGTQATVYVQTHGISKTGLRQYLFRP